MNQRVNGLSRVEFRATDAGRGSRLADLYQRAPCRVLFPHVELGEPPLAVLLTTSGGLTGGDQVTTEVVVGENAQLTVCTQAAEKLYGALPQETETRLAIRLTIGPGGLLEWLGQEAIVFDGARVRRDLDIEIDHTGQLLAVESLVLGRTAMGERLSHGVVHDAWRVRRDGRLVWIDVFRIQGDLSALGALPFGLGEAIAMATVLYVGSEAESHLVRARALVKMTKTSGGATSFDGLLIIRLLDVDAARLRSAVVTIIAGLRAAVLGLAPRIPAVWTC